MAEELTLQQRRDFLRLPMEERRRIMEEQVDEYLARSENIKEKATPEESFRAVAIQAALTFLDVKAPQGISRSTVYVDKHDIGNILPIGEALKVTVEYVPENELLGHLEDMKLTDCDNDSL